MFVRVLCEHCAENGSRIGWKVSELQAVFQSYLFSTFTAFPCSRYSTGKPVVLSQLFPAHFTRIQQYSPLQDVFSQLNKEDGSRIEGKTKRYFVNFSTKTSPDTELLLIVIAILHFIVLNIDFIHRTFPWNSLHDTASHLCCKSVLRHLLCACHVSSFLQWAGCRYSWTAERSTFDCWVQPSPGSLTWRYGPQLTGGGQCRGKWGPLPSSAQGEAGWSDRTVDPA